MPLRITLTTLVITASLIQSMDMDMDIKEDITEDITEVTDITPRLMMVITLLTPQTILSITWSLTM